MGNDFIAAHKRQGTAAGQRIDEVIVGSSAGATLSLDQQTRAAAMEAGADDGNLYVLRHDAARDEREAAAFTRASALP